MYYVHTPDYRTFTLVDADTGPVKNSANTGFETYQDPTFTDAKMFNGILNGDLVSVNDDKDIPIDLVSRGRHPTLSGILVLNSKVLYGLTSRNVPIYLFHPYDRRYPPFRVGCTDKSRTNKVATIAFEHWNRGDMFPRGALVATLGPADDFAAERAGLEVMASPFYNHKAFMGLPSYMVAPTGREMLDQESGWTVFNIDPEGCRDIDDCIALRGDEVAICIADVDAAVPSGGRVDEYAALTAQTIYHEGTAVRSMLPLALSECICSLVAGAVRPAVALRATIKDGALVNVRFQTVNIINGQSYTYEEAQGTLKETLGPLMAALRQNDKEEGAGCPPEDEDSHMWVAAAMTRYNLEAAKMLMAAGHGLLRAHSGPKAERLEALAALGPEVAARLSSEAAAYCLVAANKTHAGFGDQPYCHATSPIRRYADLVNQRVLKGTSLVVAQHELLYTLNVRGKAAKEYERACAFMKALASPIKEIDVISVGFGRAYVPAWGKLIKYDGSSGKVKYFYDATKPKWSQKIVFQAIA
jgi:exoribonuclease R